MKYTNGNAAKMERNVSIANDRLAGKTYVELSNKYGISQAHISRILNDDEIKDVIETGTRQLVSRIPLAIDNYDRILNDKEHSDHYKASKDCLQTVGILASHTSSTNITNILNVQSGPTEAQAAGIRELLAIKRERDLALLEDGDVIDV